MAAQKTVGGHHPAVPRRDVDVGLALRAGQRSEVQKVGRLHRAPPERTMAFLA